MLKSHFSTIRPRRGEDGFTLLELLIVVIVIGILAAIALPVFLTQQAAAYDASAQSDVRNTVAQVVGWQALNKGTPELTAAGYLEDGGKLVTSPHSYVGLTVAADGSYTVCGYNVKGNKYKDATHNWAFNSLTGKSAAGATNCENAVDGTGQAPGETGGTVGNGGNTSQGDKVNAFLAAGGDSSLAGILDEGLVSQGFDFMSRGATVSTPTVPTVDGKTYTDAGDSTSGVATDVVLHKADGSAFTPAVNFDNCQYAFGWASSGAGNGQRVNQLQSVLQCTTGSTGTGFKPADYPTLTFKDKDGAIDTFYTTPYDVANPGYPASNYPTPGDVYTPGGTGGGTPTPSPSNPGSGGGSNPTTGDPADDTNPNPTPSDDPAAEPTSEHVQSKANIINYYFESGMLVAQDGFNSPGNFVYPAFTYFPKSDVKVDMPEVPLINNKVFTLSDRVISDNITDVNFYTTKNGEQLTVVDGEPWRNCDIKFTLSKNDAHNNFVQTVAHCSNGVHALQYEGKDIHLSDYHWMKFTDSLGRTNWIQAELVSIAPE